MRSPGVRLLLLPLLMFVGILMSSPPNMEPRDPLGVEQSSVETPAVELAVIFSDTMQDKVLAFSVERPMSDGGDPSGALLMASSSLALFAVRRREHGSRLSRKLRRDLDRLARLMLSLRSSFAPHGGLQLRT